MYPRAPTMYFRVPKMYASSFCMHLWDARRSRLMQEQAARTGRDTRLSPPQLRLYVSCQNTACGLHTLVHSRNLYIDCTQTLILLQTQGLSCAHLLLHVEHMPCAYHAHHEPKSSITGVVIVDFITKFMIMIRCIGNTIIWNIAGAGNGRHSV